MRALLLAAGAAAAFAACSPKTVQSGQEPSILKQVERVAKTCDDDMEFRAGVAILSDDPQRPGMMGFSVGNVRCIADPVPPEETASHLAYLTAQLAPAHVFDQLQRTGKANPRFSFNYRGVAFEMQNTARGVDDSVTDSQTMYCHSYDFVGKDASGAYLASGDMKVCMPNHRYEAKNLPVVPLAEAAKGPSPAARRGPSEPRDRQYYGS